MECCPRDPGVSDRGRGLPTRVQSSLHYPPLSAGPRGSGDGGLNYPGLRLHVCSVGVVTGPHFCALSAPGHRPRASSMTPSQVSSPDDKASNTTCVLTTFT